MSLKKFVNKEDNYSIRLMNGDCLEKLKELEDNSIDSIVTDPPYGLSFMGKKWDYDVPSVEIWKECFRVLKPGGHLLAFAGTRTQHRMAVKIEDAGFEIRDMIAWVYGSGWPKSMDVSKAIDKHFGAERTEGERVWQGGKRSGGIIKDDETKTTSERTIFDTPATEEAKQWSGWGTALKPSMEPITVARKPLEEGTVAQNVLKFGTGGLNIDECRVSLNGETPYSYPNGRGGTGCFKKKSLESNLETPIQGNENGRFPANLIHDGSEEVVELFPNTGKSGIAVQRNGGGQKLGGNGICGGSKGLIRDDVGYSDAGSASRFFYCAKASQKDREEGNNHPTVKPTDLMKYLCRLVTPKNGTVLDPFMGSGSTGKAAISEGFGFVGIERDEAYFKIAQNRIG